MDDDIWTIKEVATYLKIKEKTAYALVAQGKIPGFKVGGAWRFNKNKIIEFTEVNTNKKEELAR